MLDKFTGEVYSKIPMVYKVEYLELKKVNGRELLYVVDYNDALYAFTVSNKPAPKKTTKRK